MIKNKSLTLFALCALELIFIIYCANGLNISYYEAKIFFDSNEFVGFIARLSCKIFGQNEFALRAPMVILHILSVILLYKVSKFYLKFQMDRILCVALFILFPGTLASALVLNNAGVCVFLALWIIYAFSAKQKILFFFLLALSFLANGDFLIFYLALFIFALYYKQAHLAWVGGLLFLASLYIFGFDTRGRPSGHFLDTFGIFAAVFSPFVFIFFVYTLYRIWIKEKKELLWFVCVSSFCFCMVASVRQRLELEAFLPFCIIAAPLMVRVFFNSYRVRLPKFRQMYKIFTALVVIFLALNWLCLIFNEIFYKFTDVSQKHFAYKFHVARDLADILKANGYDEIYSDDEKMGLRLKFYGINFKPDSKNLLIFSDDGKFKVQKFKKAIAKFDIIKRD